MMSDGDKLDMISAILSVQADNQNEELDQYLADSNYATEAIMCVINDIPAEQNGALRMYTEALAVTA